MSVWAIAQNDRWDLYLGKFAPELRHAAMDDALFIEPILTTGGARKEVVTIVNRTCTRFDISSVGGVR